MKGAYFQRRKSPINDSQKDAINNLFVDHLRQYGYILQYYLNYIFNFLEYIDNSNLSNVQYGDIFFRTLAPREIILLFYYSLHQEFRQSNFHKNLLLKFNIDNYIDDKEFKFKDSEYTNNEIMESIYFHPNDKILFFNKIGKNDKKN